MGAKSVETLHEQIEMRSNRNTPFPQSPRIVIRTNKVTGSKDTARNIRCALHCPPPSTHCLTPRMTEGHTWPYTRYTFHTRALTRMNTRKNHTPHTVFTSIGSGFCSRAVCTWVCSLLLFFQVFARDFVFVLFTCVVTRI